MAVVGIDLGTTNTVVGVVRGNRPSTVRDESQRHLIPSVVSFHPNGGVLAGYAAKERRLIDAKNTIYSVKRLIGRGWNSAEVALARERFPFELREGPGGAALVVARGETFTLPELSAFVLRHAKQIAERFLGESVERAVVTVPANFNDLQRAATKVAGRVAGLEVLRILNEPTAAALAYGYGKQSNERIVIYDFGGGTFDVTILDLSGSVFEVLATAGDTFLGGDDIDQAIAERMAEECLRRHRFDPREDPQAFERVRWAAERVKVALSGTPSHAETIQEIAYGPRGQALDLEFSMSRAELESIEKPIVDRTFDVCRQALEIARLTPKDLDQVVLVGGSTRSPIVAEGVADFFGQRPLDRVNPEEVVAIGAAIQASALGGAARERRSIPKPPKPAVRRSAHPPGEPGPEPGRRKRSTSIGLGAPPPPRLPHHPPPPPSKGGTLRGVQRSSERPRPSSAELPWTATPLAPPLSVQPMDAPAPPAAPLLVDVTPLGLVVETVSGYCDKVIARNTPVPCAQSRTFVTAHDHQTVVRVRVAQGESQRFSDNTILGELELSDLPSGPRGTAQVIVTFALDSDGILNVVATDAASGRETSADLKLVGLLGDADVSAMAQRHADRRAQG